MLDSSAPRPRPRGTRPRAPSPPRPVPAPVTSSPLANVTSPGLGRYSSRRSVSLPPASAALPARVTPPGWCHPLGPVPPPRPGVNPAPDRCSPDTASPGWCLPPGPVSPSEPVPPSRVVPPSPDGRASPSRCSPPRAGASPRSRCPSPPQAGVTPRTSSARSLPVASGVCPRWANTAHPGPAEQVPRDQLESHSCSDPGLPVWGRYHLCRVWCHLSPQQRCCQPPVSPAPLGTKVGLPRCGVAPLNLLQMHPPRQRV